MREIFVNAQADSGPLKSKEIGCLCFLLGILPIAIDFIYDRHEFNDEKPRFYWAYNLVAFAFNAVFYFTNTGFLVIAFRDANRRNYCMKKLSESLEFEFYKKDATSVRLPVINFLDTQTLISWLEARRIILEIGYRFQLRVQTYISYFIVIDAVMLTLLFALGSGIISDDIMSEKTWIIFGIHAVFLTTALLIVLLPTAYVNK